MPSISRKRRRSAVAVALTIGLWGALSSSGTALANVPIKVVSLDPYTNTSSFHKTEVEPDTFSFGNTVVGVHQTGRFTDGGSSNVGYVTSTDGGATWTNGFLPGTTVYANPPGPYDRATDPSGFTTFTDVRKTTEARGIRMSTIVRNWRFR